MVSGWLDNQTVSILFTEADLKVSVGVADESVIL